LRNNHSFVKDVKQDRRMPLLRQPVRRRIASKRDRMAVYEAIRSHCRLKQIHEQAQREKDAMFQERSYLQNFHNYAKEAVAGTIGGGGDSTQFPVEVANRYYPEKYHVPVRL
jgi:hypothetical protein